MSPNFNHQVKNPLFIIQRKNSTVNGNFDDCIRYILQELQENDESDEECGDA